MKISRKVFFFLFLFLVIVMNISSTNAYNPTTYKPIYINNTGGPELTYYQIPLNVTYDDDMQTDFDDLRVKYYNGSEWVFIPYWIEEKVDSNWCKLWFNATSIPVDSWCNNSYRLYYGDDTATSESDFNSTIFDNFWEPDADDDAPLPEWNPYNAKIEGHNEWGGGSWNTYGNILNFNYSNEQSQLTIDFDIKWTEFTLSTGYLDRRASFFKVYNSDNKFIFELFRAGTNKDLYEYDGPGGYQDVRDHSHKIADISTGTQYNIKITYNESGSNNWKVYFNGAYKVTVDRGDYKNDPTKKIIFRGGMSTDGGGPEGDNTFFVYFNNEAFYQKTYVSPEPTALLGEEAIVVSGYVKTPSGEPIENAYITNNVTADTDYTNVSGFYNLTLPGFWTYKITATKAGFVPKSIVVPVSDTDVTNANITLGSSGNEEIEALYISIEEVGEGYVKINASWTGFAALEEGYYFVFCNMSYGNVKKKKTGGDGILTIEETLHGLFVEDEKYCCKAAAYRENSNTNPAYTDEACFIAVANETLKQTNYGKYMDDLTDISTEMNVTLWANALSEPYKERMGMSFFGILFILPFIAMWIRGSNTIIPSILGLVLGGFIWAYMPEKFVHMAYLFIIVSIAGIVYGIFRQKI